MALNLKKGVAEVRKEAGLSLIKVAKDQGMTRQELKSQVIAAVDVSGSMADLFRNGTVDALVTRVLGLSLNVDDDGTVPVYGLDNGVHRIDTPLTSENLDGYVARHLRPLVGGGTNYAPTLQAILDDVKPGDPVYVAFFTDGDNYDHGATTEVIKKMANNPIFVQFFGIHSGRSPEFAYLRQLDTMGGRKIDNAGTAFVNLNTVTEEELYAAMMNEYPRFVKEAHRIGLLPWTQKVGASSGGVGGMLGNLFGRR